MNISSILNIQNPSIEVLGQIAGLQTPAQIQQPEQTFEAFLRSLVDNVNETSESINVAQQFQLDIATGKSDDILGLVLAMERANASLNFTVQITNRLLEAYREIMRMQI